MRRRHALIGGLLAGIWGVAVLRGQEVQRTAETLTGDSLLRHNNASIVFDRNVNTFNWVGRVAIDTSVSATHVRLNEQFISNVILMEGAPQEQRLRSDQHRLSLFLSRPLTGELSARAQWSSLAYADNKAVGLSSASMNSLLAGFEYAPWEFFSITPLLGHRWENQLGIRDRGMSYALGAQMPPLDIDGYRFAGSAQLQEDRINPRVLDRHIGRLSVSKNFLGTSHDSLEIGMNRNRHEFYSVSDNTIESRVENIFAFSNLLDYDVSRSIVTSLYVSLMSRGLDKDLRSWNGPALSPLLFNTGIDEFRLESYVELAYHNNDGRTMASARLYHGERTERHFVREPDRFQADSIRFSFNARNADEQRKDNTARRTILMGLCLFPLSFADTVSLSGSAGILRYDTPSDENYEDRDELLVVLSLTTTHRISQYLDLSLTLDGTLSHLVYLLRQRSGNNNYNRILRLSPRTTYRPLRSLVTMNQFEVLANYTVYDFEEQSAPVRTLSYRQFAWIDSTALEFTPRIGLDFFLYVKLYERGQLNWREFSERRENSFVDRTYATQLRFSPFPGTVFAVGVRYFSQSRYTYNGNEKSLDSFLRSVGPTCLLLWEAAPARQVGLKGWYEHRRLPDGSSRALANMTLTVQYTL